MQYNIKFKDIDSNSGDITAQSVIAQTFDEIYAKMITQVLNTSEDSPNREFYYEEKDIIEADNKQMLLDQYPEEEFLFMDGYDKGIIGVDDISRKVVYSHNLCILQLMNDDGMSEEDAMDHFEFNSVRSNEYLGDDHVIIVRDI